MGVAAGQQGHVARAEEDGRGGPELEPQGAVFDEVQHAGAGGMALAVGAVDDRADEFAAVQVDGLE